MEKEKKDSNLVVILVMLLLILLIALPPTFRMLFPKEENTKSDSAESTTTKTNSMTSLSCRKTSTDGYNITINTIYENNDVSKLTLSYIMAQNNNTTTEDTTTENTQIPPNENTQTSTAETTEPQATVEQQPTASTTTHQVADNTLAEIELLKSITNIKVNETDTAHQFQLDMKKFTYKTIPDDLTLRVQSLSLQRAFYENSGYNCSVNNN